MDINKVLLEYDNMFGVSTFEQIDDFLTEKIEEALGEGDQGSALTLMNEMIGFCRDIGLKEKGLHFCGLIQRMLVSMHLEGTTEYGTSLLNVANALRAFGDYKKSRELYLETETIYQANLKHDDFAFSSLYNNWSLLYEEMGDYSSAETLLRKALAVVDKYPGAEIEQATTRCNLAMAMFTQCREEQERKKDSAFGGGLDSDYYEMYEEACRYLDRAMEIYEADGGRDFHYSAALSAKGDSLMLSGEYASAADYFKRAMEELEKHVGRTEAYFRVEERYMQAKKRAGIVDEEPTPEAVEPTPASCSVRSQPPTHGPAPVTLTPEPTLMQEITADPEPVPEPIPAPEPKAAPVQEKPAGGHIAVCRDFYERYGAEMIRQKFPQYEQRIAVGMAGEGSDCFGFEDEISKDHDYALGFCMWLTQADYERIGITLNKAYEDLVAAHAEEYGFFGTYMQADGRRGAMTIENFFDSSLGLLINENYTPQAVLTDEMWMRLDEASLAQTTNGEVWRDDLGKFSAIRNALLAYYPESVWRMRMAKALHNFSQAAQSNYPRMMAREDYVSAELCKAQGIRSALEVAYLLNRTYAPYYKWLRKGANRLAVLKTITKPLDNISLLPPQRDAWDGVEYNAAMINTADLVVKQFEKVAAGILGELKMQDLADGNDTFLDLYVNGILGTPDDMADSGRYEVKDNDYSGRQTENNKDTVISLDDPAPQQTVSACAAGKWDGDKKAPDRTVDPDENPDRMTKDQLVESIVRHEWMQFDDVKNEGGRADCQDNWTTFSIMRKSQYMTWDQELLTSYLHDLINAEKRGWNMITEKYGRMMKSTAPAQYEAMKDSFPEHSEEHDAIAEAIISIQVEWMEIFAKKYPKMAGQARRIHTQDDTPFETSYETYLRGELGTYSDDTLYLYGRFIVSLQRQGKNLAYMIMDNTAKLYGYRDVGDAELKMV